VIARSIIETNVVGVLHLIVALLPLLLKQPQATVLATTSGSAFVPNAMYPTYSASQAFLHSERTGLYDAPFAKRNQGTG
jgi:uncharacterized oxidoreductase